MFNWLKHFIKSKKVIANHQSSMPESLKLLWENKIIERLGESASHDNQKYR